MRSRGKKASSGAVASEGGLAFVPPCLARLAAAPEGPGFVHEIKFDGYRVQAHVIKNGDGARVRIFTRSGLDWTDRFSGLVPELAALPVTSAILDGEAVVIDEDGRTSFSALQAALKTTARGRGAITLVAFDLLHRDGRDLTGLPLSERIAQLGEVLGSRPADARVQASLTLDGSGREVLAAACAMGLEGIVSKRLDRPYRPGRHGDWIKAKCARSSPFAVVGYVAEKTSPERVGSLVLAWQDGDLWRHAGRVGTGFSRKEAAAMWQGLQAIRRTQTPLSGRLTASQGRDVVWLEPKVVAQVTYRDVTDDGLLRHATFDGLRTDIAPQDTAAPSR